MANQIVEYFRRALIDFGHLGLSDDDMLKATKQALTGDTKGNRIATHIKEWLDGEFKPFKLSIQKAFGDDLGALQPAVEAEMKRYTKAQLLEKTHEIIEAFRKELADFGWSALLYKDVFKATKLGLKMNFFDEARGEIDATLQPIAWHIHVLLQEPEYAHLKPILEEGLNMTIKEGLQTPDRTAESKMKTPDILQSNRNEA